MLKSCFKPLLVKLHRGPPLVWREFGWFSLEKRSLQGDLRAAFPFLKRAYRKAGIRECSDRPRDNSFKLKE